MVEQDDSKLKILQLECIIASKDKEISLLREQLSEDQEVCLPSARVVLAQCLQCSVPVHVVLRDTTCECFIQCPTGCSKHTVQQTLCTGCPLSRPLPTSSMLCITDSLAKQFDSFFQRSYLYKTTTF